MGNQTSTKSSFQQHNWRQLQNKNNRVILYNDITMKSIERHQAVLEFDQGQAIQVCKWRENLPQQSCIIDLYQYGIKRSGMCNGLPDLYVISQRIHLLQQIGRISKPEAFLILRDVSSGLRILFKKFGIFNPRPNIIGINAEGKAKVWTNQNFAKFLPQKDKITIQTSELGIVNNLIRLLEAKSTNDDFFPIDYPRNLDLISVCNYINQVFANLKGYQVDRVYIDRNQFAKKYRQIKQRNQQQQLSRTKAMEAQRRLQQIQQLHKNLSLQQLQLQRKQQLLLLQAKQQQQLAMQQQLLQLQRQKQLQLQKQRQKNSIQNSQGKVMKGTTSTAQTQNYYPNNNNAYYNQGNAGHILQNYYQPYQQNQLPQPTSQDNNSRQSLAINLQSQKTQQQQILIRQMSPRPPLPPSQNYPSQNRNQTYQQQQIPRKNSIQSLKSASNFKKQIQMVDSMILLQEDQLSENQNKRIIESRIISYPV